MRLGFKSFLQLLVSWQGGPDRRSYSREWTLIKRLGETRGSKQLPFLNESCWQFCRHQQGRVSGQLYFLIWPFYQAGWGGKVTRFITGRPHRTVICLTCLHIARHTKKLLFFLFVTGNRLHELVYSNPPLVSVKCYPRHRISLRFVLILYHLRKTHGGLQDGRRGRRNRNRKREKEKERRKREEGKCWRRSISST